jgi:glycosyltransferase involved in cell wall biosynthesis
VISSNHSPKFSLLMPSYNAETYIEDAIASGLSAIGPGDELIIQDGASQDSTCEIAMRWAKLDRRISFESIQDRGQSDALNKALRKASGDYIGWLNADDLITADGLEAIRRQLKLLNYPMVGVGEHGIVTASGSYIRRYQPGPLQRSKLLSRGCYVFSGSMFVRADILRAIGGFSPKYDFCMDLDVMLTLVEHPDFTQARVPVLVGSLRWHSGSKSGGQGVRFIADGWRVRRAHSRALSDIALSLYAAFLQSISTATTPLRHSPGYLWLRGAQERSV